MQGFTDLTKSERGILTLVLVLAVTILVVLDKVTGADWLAYTKWTHFLNMCSMRWVT